MADGKRLGVAVVGSVLTGALVTYVAGAFFGWGQWNCDSSGGLETCAEQGIRVDHLGLAAVVSGLVLGAWLTILERPRILLGAQGALPYRSTLMITIAVATGVGVLGGTVTTTTLRGIGWKCEGSACPDGITYGIPFLNGAAVTAVIALAVGVIRIARRLEPTLRAALVVDLVRLASTPMLLLGVPAILSFLVGGYLPILGYAVLLFLGGLGPLQARWGGRGAFMVTTVVFALAAFGIAFPAPLVSPLLIGYGMVLLLATAIAVISPSEARPYGWVDVGNKP